MHQLQSCALCMTSMLDIILFLQDERQLSGSQFRSRNQSSTTTHRKYTSVGFIETKHDANERRWCFPSFWNA